MIVSENIEQANNILKKKFPPDSFFEEQNIILLSTEELKNSNMILLHSLKKRYIYIEENNLHLLQESMGVIQEIKSKAQIKREKSHLRYQAIRLELYEDIKSLLSTDKLFFEKNLPLYDDNIDFIKREIRLLTNRICKIKSDFNEISSMRKHIKSEYKLLKNNLSELNTFDLDIKHEPFSLIIGDSKNNIFEEKFFSDYILHCSEIKKNYLSNIEIPFTFYEQDTVVHLEIQYNNSLIENKDAMDIAKIEPISSKLSFLKDIKFSAKELTSYINEVFDKIIINNSLIHKDELLKESIFENYFGKITAIGKRPTVKINLSIPDKINENKVLNKLKRTILKEVFDANERRIAGFTRSVNRKVIQNVIEIDSFKNLFPEARMQKRNIHFFCGETNSGKTYTAFEKASEFNSGLYAAPLRLLALEGQQEFEKRGKLCSMITGEERNLKEGAKFISSTVEMIDYSKEYDVAIIDEVQLINDRDRGHAWFEAIVGINAKEIYLVGAEDIDSVLQDVIEYLDEKMTKTVFTRKTKIEFDKELYNRSIEKDGKLPPHSAVIAFSKNKVLKLKQKFEEMGNKVSVIYGALPPEVRRIETERFVSGKTDVIISTDAIGMGLNLPIENIFFFEKEKYDGVSTGNLEIPLVKQIVGRAGRYKKFEIGYVSALSEDVFDFIQTEFYKDSVVTEKNLKCSPNYPIIKQISNITEEISVFKLLQNYNNAINFDFDIKNHMNDCAYKIARFVDTKDQKDAVLTLKEKVKLINAPVSDDRAGEVLGFFKDSIKCLFLLKKNSNVYPYDILMDLLNNLRVDSQKHVEISIKKLDIISWMAFNFEDFECIHKDISNMKKQLNKQLITYLRK